MNGVNRCRTDGQAKRGGGAHHGDVVIKINAEVERLSGHIGGIGRNADGAHHGGNRIDEYSGGYANTVACQRGIVTRAILDGVGADADAGGPDSKSLAV